MLYLPGVMHQRRVFVTAAIIAALSVPRALEAHEIPQRVAVLGFVRAEGTRLELLLRVPLEAMRDVEFPLRGDGMLDVVAARARLADAAQVWLVDYLTVDADGSPLGAPRLRAARLALPSDRSFTTLAGARASFDLPELDQRTSIAWQQAMLDVRLEYDLPAAGVHLVLHPALAHLGVRTASVLHIVGSDGGDRVLTYQGNPERVVLEPRWTDAVTQFVGAGFRHILGGIDHLLFVLCLVFPVRRWRSLVAVVTAFTLAHSLTLGASALGLAPGAGWFPPLVEVLIAVSIVWLAIENIVLPAEKLAERWAIAFAFGLVHGFGFSFALADQLQFAGGHLLMALASFNLGAELGQLLVLAAALPLLQWMHRRVGAQRERLVTIVGSVIVAHTAWHWMTERFGTLTAYRGTMAWPALDAAFALGAMRFALLGCLALALALALRQILRTVRAS